EWVGPWRALTRLLVPACAVKWPDFSTRYLPHAATELACGLVAPAALIAGFIWRPRLVIRRMKWELLLLLFLLVLCMLPSAGVFRWSFRWLPFLHLVLALCAAEALASFSQKQKRFAAFLLFLFLILIVIIALIAKTGGEHLFPLAWIFLGLALGWLLVESLD